MIQMSLHALFLFVVPAYKIEIRIPLKICVGDPTRLTYFGFPINLI